MSRFPYHERPDLEKIRSQCGELTDLRKDWWAAVAELTLNLAVHREFAARSTFDAESFNDLLKWANGLSGKLLHLLPPMVHGGPECLRRAKALIKIADCIDQKRNTVVHQGEFCNEAEAMSFLEVAERLVTQIVCGCQPLLKLSPTVGLEQEQGL